MKGETIKEVAKSNDPKAKMMTDDFMNQLSKTASIDNNLTGDVIQPPYSSPLISLSDLKTPGNTRDILLWCKYFYTTDALITGAINALANFPITEIFLEEPHQEIVRDTEETDQDIREGDVGEVSEDEQEKKSGSVGENKSSEKLKTYQRVLFSKLDITKFLVEIGIDYWLYGNCFVLGDMGTNEYTGKPEWKSMTRLDPSRITIDVNPHTREKIYKWTPSDKLMNIVREKKPIDIYDTIPDKIREAVLQNKAIVLNSDVVYHFSRPSDSLGDDSAWGAPVVFNVLKMLMYKNKLRQAQEAIAQEHIVPFRVYYLNPVAGVNINANYRDVATQFAQELRKSVRDPNYKVVSPVPVNQINSGGDGRALLLVQEIAQVQDEILAGMNVPREFVFGGVSYSASSIALKILENQFITYRIFIKKFLQEFVIKKMAKARGEWKTEKDDEFLIEVILNDMKMNDDVQQKQMIANFNAQGKVSDDYLYKVFGISPEKMKTTIHNESLAKIKQNAEIQIAEINASVEVQLAQMKAQQKIQEQANAMGLNASMPEQEGEEVPQEGEVPQEHPTEEQGNQPSEQDIMDLANRLTNMPEGEKQGVLSQLDPQISQAVQSAMAQIESQQNMEVDDRPMPEKLPPRRKTSGG